MKVYEEGGSSAFRDKLKVFKQMIEDAKSSERLFDGIAFYALSRFARRQLKLSQVLEGLLDVGVKVFSITEDIPFDKDEGFIAKTVLGMVNELYSRQNSRTVADGMDLSARNGFFCGSRPPYGYQTYKTDIPARSGVKKRLIVNPEEAEIVKKIFALAEHGVSGFGWGVKCISAYLNKEGILRRGRKWDKNRVHELLTDPVVTGLYTWGKKRLRKEPDRLPVSYQIDPIIDEEKFEGIKKILSSRAPEKTASKAERSPSLLSGILKCAYCNCNMVIETGKGGRYKY